MSEPLEEVSSLVNPTTRYKRLSMVPLSLPENRTEDEHLGLLRWLDATTQTESRCIGTQTDENGVEREVWQHTMTPLPASPKRWARSIRSSTIRKPNRALIRMIYRSVRQQKAEERARKRKRRQRRAAQRRQRRGLA